MNCLFSCVFLLLMPLFQQSATEAEELRTLFARCGSELSWSTSWEEASELAQTKRRPILILFSNTRGLTAGDPAKIGPFMDPDIIDLVRERYVLLRFHSQMQAPFKNQDSYGVGPLTFGTSILIANAEGNILANTYTLEATTLFEFLARQAAHLEVSSSPPSALSADTLYSWHVRRGEDDQAMALLANPSTAEEYLMLARMHQRRRNGKQVLNVLERARKSGVADADLALAKAKAYLRQDRLHEARETLDLVSADHADSLEAMSLRMELLLAVGEVEEAIRIAEDLVTKHPDSRWAWIAAYVLLNRPFLNLMKGQSLAWPDAETTSMLQLAPFEKLSPPSWSRARADAAHFLLNTQRADGSWPNGFEVMTQTDSRRFPLTVATTALCARALLPFHEQGVFADAIRRALAFVKEARRIAEEKGDSQGGFDYTVWEKPCILLFLHDAIESGVVSFTDWQESMAALVEEMRVKQKPGGGWTYYPTTSNLSFSFVTAFVLLGLQAAQESGIEVPEEMSNAALDCLESMRRQDGMFAYSLEAAKGNFPNPAEGGTAGRAPLCALSLWVWGRTDLDDVQRMLDVFLRNRAVYAREHGKTLMHCGPGGEGSHYLMFDYAYCAAAISVLPCNRQIPYRGALLDQIANARLASGAFLDNPILGDRFGSAMALWSMQLLHTESH